MLLKQQMLSLCKFVKSVCVSAAISSSFVDFFELSPSHSSHSTVCVDLSLYFIVLLFMLLLLLLLFRLVLSVNWGSQKTKEQEDFRGFTWILRSLRFDDWHVTLNLLFLIASCDSHHDGRHHRCGARCGWLTQSFTTICCHHALSYIPLRSNEDDVELLRND